MVYDVNGNVLVQIDDTLTVANAAADAKATGEKVSELKSAISNLDYFTRKDGQVFSNVLSVTQGQARPASNLVFEENIPSGCLCTFRLEDTGSHIGRYAVYSNQSAVLYNLVVNMDYTFTASGDINSVSIYYSRDDALATGNVTAILKAGRLDSLETGLDSLEIGLDSLETRVDTNKDLINIVNENSGEYLENFLVLSDGFVGSNGVINTSHANGEKYSQLIAVQENESFEIITDLKESGHVHWMAVTEYDENETFIRRDVLIAADQNITTQTATRTYTVPSGVMFIRIMSRLYNNGTLRARQVTSLARKVESLSERIQAMPVSYVSKTVKTIAHRGDDIDAPQCVAAAYIYARKRGHTIAENDVWNSEDGQLVMWHDTTLSRLGNLVDVNGYAMYTDGTNYYWVNANNNVYTYDFTNSQYVSSSVSLNSLTRCVGSAYGVNSDYDVIGLNFDILKRIDFGVYKGAKFKGEQILTFAEWVLLCKQLGMEIYVDRKLVYTQDVVTELVNTVKSYGMLDKTSWINVGISAIELIRAIDPNARCGLLTHPTEALITTYTPYNVGRGFFFNGNGKEMNRESIQLGLNAGFEVEVWYVDFGSATEGTIFQTLRTAVDYGCTGVTTDKYRIDEAFENLLNKYD